MQRLPAGFLPPVAMDTGSESPIYQQLAEWFRRAISSGQLRPGQRVPSTRGLASALGISRIPVLGAYEQLQSEGFLETFTGAGTCVARAIPADTQTARRACAAPAATPAGSRRTSRRAALLRSPEPSWLASMGAFRVGVPALDAFPVALWSRLVARHARQLSPDAMAYGDPMGHLPLREAVAEYLAASRGVRCEAAQILITTGSQQSLQICAHVLLDPCDRVWMEDPGYPGAHQALRTAGAELVPVPVDAQGIDVAHGERVGADARAVYISPSHQFPLGMAMSASRRMQLLRWAAQHEAWIIEDDYDSEYRFGSRPLSALQGMDTQARVIYLGTFSKVMFPALRLGYLVVPKDLVADFHAGRDAIDTFSAMLYQSVMTEFISEGHFARHLRRMRALYMARRQAVHQAIQRYLGDRLQVIGSEAGMQLAGLLPEGVDDIAVSRRAAERGVSVRPLTPCYLQAPPRGGLILGYGGVNQAQIEDAVRRLADCF